MGGSALTVSCLAREDCTRAARRIGTAIGVSAPLKAVFDSKMMLTAVAAAVTTAERGYLRGVQSDRLERTGAMFWAVRLERYAGAQQARRRCPRSLFHWRT